MQKLSFLLPMEKVFFPYRMVQVGIMNTVPFSWFFMTGDEREGIFFKHRTEEIYWHKNVDTVFMFFRHDHVPWLYAMCAFASSNFPTIIALGLAQQFYFFVDVFRELETVKKLEFLLSFLLFSTFFRESINENMKRSCFIFLLLSLSEACQNAMPEKFPYKQEKQSTTTTTASVRS